MKTAPVWFRMFIRVVGGIAPWLLLGYLYRLFWNLRPRMAVRDDAEAVHRRARQETLSVGDRTALVYRWGTGPETVLLVHGWRGRASQFTALVEALESPQRTVVAFDAPGNGDAPGDRTDLRDYLAVIRIVADRAGGLDLLVAHSFGVLGMFVAVREGVRARRLVSIAGPADIDYTFAAFKSAVSLPSGLGQRLRRRIERDAFAGDTGLWRRFVAELDPSDSTPLLVIHDRNDRAVDFGQSSIIAGKHPGVTTELFTNGLGHTRVLEDSQVLDAVAAFASEPAQTR